MKSISHRNPPARRTARRGGFALVITLSLMILLALLAVGLLSLSAVTLRQSAGLQATAEARANARLAVMLAIGDLQKLLGPDRAVTVPADLVLPPSQAGRRLTGVWESWAINPGSSAPDYAGEKEKRFRQWLVSDPRPEDRASRTYATKAPLEPILLSSGENAEKDGIVAGRVRAGRTGAFAWHVSDESSKARIDLARDPEPGASLAERRGVVAGHRPYTRDLAGGGAFKFAEMPGDTTKAEFTKATGMLPKLVDLDQVELLGGEMPPQLRHELTTHSMGVLCDARDGGLKKDLTTAFTQPGGLPAELRNERLYHSTHGYTAASDPYWSTLSGFHNLHTSFPANGPPSYKLANVEAAQVDRENVPRSYTLAPVIQKFEVMFTVVARDYHGPHVNNLKRVDPERKYMAHLVYLPVFTLYNPYNVELEFERLNVIARDLPVAFNFFINGEAQNSRYAPFNEMWVGTGDGNGRGEKSIRFDLANWQYVGESNPSSPVRMRPGQTLIFSPYMDPADTSAKTLRSSWGTKDELETNANKAMKLRPGFTGKAVGLSVDYLCPDPCRSGSAILHNAASPSKGVLGLRWDDRLHVETAIRRPETGSRDEWDVSAKIVVGGREIQYGGMRFVYEDEASLMKHFKDVWRYPATGSLATSEFYEPYTKPIKDQSRSRAIVAFSTAARTCSGGIYENNTRDQIAGGLNVLRDGRLAGKPFLHHNPARNAILVNLKSDIPGHFSHELNFQPLKGELDDVIEIDALNRGAAITGNTTVKGIKSGALFDVPSGPMQTLAGFRRSNALSSTYLPHPVQPVANSWVPPMMGTEFTRQNGVAAYPLLDHSYLANHALYDGYYFSTFAARDKTAAKDVFKAFVEEGTPLLNQSFLAWRPGKALPGKGAATLFSGGTPTADAWKESSSWQMVTGAFNVNSTSVLAWKAMLSSLANTKIPVLWAKGLQLEQVGGKDEVPLPSFTMHLAGQAENANIVAAKIDNRRTNEWNGYRTLGPTELDILARKIVDEVKQRGPFLSVSEFVNRRIGYNTELTRVGALQAAIDKSELNNRMFRDIAPVRLQDVSDPAIYGYKTPDIAVGNAAEGAPGTLCQGDLLHVLEPRITVRGDTFVIRAAGQALDRNGKVIATAHAEAVVQRVPDFIDSANPAATPLGDLNSANRRFGRRMEVANFRWLHPNEI